MSVPRKQNQGGLPLHPGEMLREEFLVPLRITAELLAKKIKVPKYRVASIVRERKTPDSDMCLRLARYFRMSPEFWMRITKDYELETSLKQWPTICKEVSRHPKDRMTGALRVPINM